MQIHVCALSNFICSWPPGAPPPPWGAVEKHWCREINVIQSNIKAVSVISAELYYYYYY